MSRESTSPEPLSGQQFETTSYPGGRHRVGIEKDSTRFQDPVHFGVKGGHIWIAVGRLDIDHCVEPLGGEGDVLGVAADEADSWILVNPPTELDGDRREINADHLTGGEESVQNRDCPAATAPHIEYAPTRKLAVANDLQDELDTIAVQGLAGELVNGALAPPIHGVPIVEKKRVFLSDAGVELLIDRVVETLDRRLRASVRSPTVGQLVNEVVRQQPLGRRWLGGFGQQGGNFIIGQALHLIENPGQFPTRRG